MITPATRRQISGMIVYVLVGLAIIVLRLMPLSTGSVRLPGPDLLLCLSFAWVLRRPREAPAPLITGLVLIEDLVTLRPVGLWALAVLNGTEAARLRERRWRDQGFLVEWLRVAIVMGLMMLSTRLILLIVLKPVPPLGQAVLQFLATAGAYPVVVIVARWVLGLRQLSSAEQELQG